MTLHEATSLEPLVKKVTVPATPERAFQLFTAEISAWWPLPTHSIGATSARSLTFGAGVGGQIVEYGDDGPLGVWGTVSVWDPPHEVAFSWHPGHEPGIVTQVSVRFTAVAEGTEVALTHTDWHRRPDGAAARAEYDTGWTYVLARYATSAAAA
jgi:uncharacterized protein YndB with AHSA1/START domain